MEVQAAQKEVRTVFLGGSVGQAVSGLIWLVSAALGTWVSPQAGIITLTLGGVFIFPLTQLAIRLTGQRATLSKENPFNALAMQIAFIVPLLIPVIFATIRSDPNWFYPAFMMVVGAHYLPFMTLYGMKQYAALAGLLIVGGLALRVFTPGLFALGGWATGAVLLLFAGLIWRTGWEGVRKAA